MSTSALWRVSASTLGAPGDSLAEVIAPLVENQVYDVELRAAPDALVNTSLTPDERSAIRQRLTAAGIQALSVASGVKVGADDPTGAFDDDVRAHAQLASDLGARFIRVFPAIPMVQGPFTEVPVTLGSRAEGEAAAAERLTRAVRIASDHGVRIALETHDSNPRGQDLVRILDQMEDSARRQVGVIWDFLHPWRTGEAPARTWEALSHYILDGRGYVQVKDVASPALLTPVLQGTGLVPLDEILTLLDAGGYEGPISLEWERTWYPEVEPLGQALAAAAREVRAFQHVPTR